jgi:GNAT superfamily N-acetyltransferase
MPSAGPDYPRWTETLRDRTRVLIRPITTRDESAERSFIETLSLGARRFRFLGQVSHPSEHLIKQLTGIDFEHEVAFAAVIPEGSQEKIIGVSRYSADKEGLHCECAVTVSDEWQQKGLGTLLMKHLIEVARSKGIRTMTSIDSAENVQMQDLVQFLGFTTRTDPDDPSQVLHELELEESPPAPAPAATPKQ